MIVCYKDDPAWARQRTRSSPRTPAWTRHQWRLSPVNQPENALQGTMFESLFDYSASFPWVVANASHWVYAKRGLQNGQSIPGLIGYEYDKVFNNGQTPAGLQDLALPVKPTTRA